MFNRREDTLYAEQVSLADIAQEVGTPFYCYAGNAITGAYTALTDALKSAGLANTLVCYSVKANGNLALLRLLAKAGAGADIVSGGELARARQAKIPAEKIVFSGVGKTADELDAALAENIYQFNVESLAELELLAARATASNSTANIALRVNPDIDAQTHKKITTGRAENKFGMEWAQAQEAVRQASAQNSLNLCGLDIHIGSQITQLAPFASAFTCLAEWTQALRDDNHTITRLDVGGGVGIAYAKHDTALAWGDYAKTIAKTLGHLDCQIILEPGRALLAPAGVLVGRVLQHKTTASKNFLITDAAMTELLRPTLYDAQHHIEAVRSTNAPEKKWDIVGPLCETGDYLAQDRQFSAPQAGELIAVYDVGAYGATLGLTYNARLPAPEVLVLDDQFFVIRKRPALAQLWQNETIPPMLK